MSIIFEDLNIINLTKTKTKDLFFEYGDFNYEYNLNDVYNDLLNNKLITINDNGDVLIPEIEVIRYFGYELNLEKLASEIGERLDWKFKKYEKEDLMNWLNNVGAEKLGLDCFAKFFDEEFLISGREFMRIYQAAQTYYINLKLQEQEEEEN